MAFEQIDNVAGTPDTLPEACTKINNNTDKLESDTAGEGASLIAVESGSYTATDVQGALEEIEASIAGASGHIIEEDSSDVNVRSQLNFTGAGVALSDDA